MATTSRAYSPGSAVPSAGPTTEITINLTPFDQRHYRRLIEARGETIRRVVKKLRPALGLTNAVDAGCGVGFYAQTLEECGLNVCGFDGRGENIREARRRFPQIPFEQGDIQDRNILELGRFDLSLCFGLLYHLESPLLALRNLRAMTEKCLLLESICLPGETSQMMLRAEPPQVDQSLTDVACYQSEGSLTKMLYRAGFAMVYRVIPLPDHEDFCDTPTHAQRRTVLLASSAPIDVAGFRLLPEPAESADPWAKARAGKASLPVRVRRFLSYPTRAKYLALAQHAKRVFPRMPIPMRLQIGAWWLAENGALDHELFHGSFEQREMRFVQKILRPGMTVLDVGAHHGLYTLLASKRVGRRGRVIAIEPSPRESKRLERHVRVNRCKNVRVQRSAVGRATTESDFFVVDGFRDWGNSLRPPAVPEPTQKIRVGVQPIDEILAQLNIARVDFVKLDVEGAELDFLNGASKLLRGGSRPAILAEVQDIRTLPWGYPAREIIQFLSRVDYRWFALNFDNTLVPVSCDLDSYDANLVALPAERVEEYRQLLANS